MDSSARSTTGPEMVNLGRHVTTNWRSDDFSGTSYREWSGDVDYFRFHFAETAGAQIGLIGKMRGPNSNWGGRRIDALPERLFMSTNARMENLVGTQYMFGIYGWTHEQDASWSGNGWNNEFYAYLAMPFLKTRIDPLGSTRRPATAATPWAVPI
jgi:hypothetical protein